jgi:hypothetical protein
LNNAALHASGITVSGAAAWPAAINTFARHNNGSAYNIYAWTPINTSVSQGWHSFKGLYTAHGAEPSMELRIMGCNGLAYTGLGVGISPVYNNGDFGGRMEWEFGAASPASAVWRCSIANSGSIQPADISITMGTYVPVFNVTSGYNSATPGMAINNGLISKGLAGHVPYASITIWPYGQNAWVNTYAAANAYWADSGASGIISGGWAMQCNLLGDMVCKTIAQISDVSTKRDIQPLGASLAKILQLHAVRYRPINDDALDIGLVAQDVVGIYPEAVKYPTPAPVAEGETPNAQLLAINYSALIGPIIEAIRELTARVAALEGA